MVTYNESFIDFHFDTSKYDVVRFDRTPYFKAYSGHGYKGVDFVTVERKGLGQINLIEAKNYTVLFENQKGHPTDIFIRDFDDIMASIVDKFVDTLRLFRGTYSRYEESSIFRVSYSIYRKVNGIFGKTPPWAMVGIIHEHLQNQDPLVAILALDYDQTRENAPSLAHIKHQLNLEAQRQEFPYPIDVWLADKGEVSFP